MTLLLSVLDLLFGLAAVGVAFLIGVGQGRRRCFTCQRRRRDFDRVMRHATNAPPTRLDQRARVRQTGWTPPKVVPIRGPSTAGSVRFPRRTSRRSA
jgi:hypothetical protein